MFISDTRIPLSPSFMSWRFSGISVVIMGSPAAIASMRAFDIPSKSVGRMKQLEILRSCGTSVRRPRKSMLFFDR